MHPPARRRNPSCHPRSGSARQRLPARRSRSSVVPGSQAVEAIGEVDGVGEPHHEQQARAASKQIRAGTLDRLELIRSRRATNAAGYQSPPTNTRLRREAEARVSHARKDRLCSLSCLAFPKIVEVADRARPEERDQNQPERGRMRRIERGGRDDQRNRHRRQN